MALSRRILPVHTILYFLSVIIIGILLTLVLIVYLNRRGFFVAY
ncbi:MAG: hypothetical protein R3E31_02095 [Chloroflexota bacterium]